jgi:PadR family transcriptional regulator, regulatory protein PadR
MDDLLLLAALTEGPAYGYALKKTAGLVVGGGELHNNVVYPSLKRFVRNGWVTRSSVPGERGQMRKLYRITAAGKKHLLEQMRSFGDQEQRDEAAFLLRVAFFDALSADIRRSIISARRSFLTGRAVELARFEKATRRPRSFSLAALRRAQSRVRDELRWIQRIGASVES